MRIRVTASSGAACCVRPCFAHAVWGAHGIYRNMEMGHGKGEKKRKGKRTICIGHVQSQEVTRSNQEEVA